MISILHIPIWLFLAKFLWPPEFTLNDNFGSCWLLFSFSSSSNIHGCSGQWKFDPLSGWVFSCPLLLDAAGLDFYLSKQNDVMGLTRWDFFIQLFFNFIHYFETTCEVHLVLLYLELDHSVTAVKNCFPENKVCCLTPDPSNLSVRQKIFEECAANFPLKFITSGS